MCQKPLNQPKQRRRKRPRHIHRQRDILLSVRASLDLRRLKDPPGLSHQRHACTTFTQMTMRWQSTVAFRCSATRILALCVVRQAPVPLRTWIGTAVVRALFSLDQRVQIQCLRVQRSICLRAQNRIHTRVLNEWTSPVHWKDVANGSLRSTINHSQRCKTLK